MIKSTAHKPRVLLSAGMIQAGHSGVGRYVVELANRMAAMESIDLYVAGLDADRGLFERMADDRWLSIPAAFGGGVKNLIWHQWHLPRLLRLGHYDLLHIPSYRRIVGYCPVPQIATVHDCAPFHLRDKYGFLRGLFGRHLAPWLARRCDRIVSVSESSKQDIVKFYHLGAERVDVVLNGLDHHAYHPMSAEQLASFRQNKGFNQPYFLYISRLEHPGKNHLRLIQAYESYREQSGANVQLVLGGAPWLGAEVIEARVAASPYRADIRMAGFLAESDLPGWYAAAEALIFPSLMEGFGLPVIEALACGLRVATSNCSSLPEVGGAAALYFDPYSTVEIAAALLTLCRENGVERASRIEQGLQQAARYDWDQAAMATCQLYLKTINVVPSP
ncbi:MAG: glycosyltransferase involved in cell wall biosynthesis [Lentimonas sp.]|jgi:glycosyltransferase involved in cell wall biosynthesis